MARAQVEMGSVNASQIRDGLVPDLDPRSIAARNAMADRQSPMGHIETVVKSTHVRRSMIRGQEYSMK